MPEPPAGPPPGPRPHGSRNLRYLLASTSISVTGDGVLFAAAPLLAASLTTEPVGVAAVSAAGYSAWLITGLPAGALVDRWPRRPVMVITDLFRAATLAGCAVLIARQAMTVPLLLIAVFSIGVGSCFFEPAAQATVPALVSRDRAALERANGQLWSLDTLGRLLVGPLLGAELFNLSHVGPFLLDAGSFLASAFLVSRLPHAAPALPHQPSIVRAMADGAQFTWTEQELRALTFGMAIFNIGWNLAMATLVLFSRVALGVGIAGYGLLLSTAALGGMAGGWITPLLMQRSRAGQIFIGALLLQAAAWICAFFADHAWQIAGSLIAVGAASSAVSVAGSSARQHLSPPHLIGRVTSATRLVSIGSAAAGSLAGGMIAQEFGLRSPFLMAAVLLALGGVVYAGRGGRAVAGGDPPSGG